jgi:hypothetical protein
MKKEEEPKSYLIKAVCLNCNHMDELKIPYGVDAECKTSGIYLYSDEQGYYNLDTKKYQNVAFYPRCSLCGSTSLKKQMHIENAIKTIEQQLENIQEVINEIKRGVE